MIEEYLLDIVTKLGFPVFVAMWFMMRTEKVIDRNTQAFHAMAKYHELLEEDK